MSGTFTSPDFLSQDDAKAWLQLTDNSQDIMVLALNQATTQVILNYLNREPRQGTYTEYYNGTQSNRIMVNQFPIVSVSSIGISPPGSQTGTSNPVDMTYVYFDEDVIYNNNGIFPRGTKNIGISYTAGLVDPSLNSIYLAARYILKGAWNAMQSDPNVSSESFTGVVSQSYWQEGPGSIPPQAKVLLEPFRSRWSAR